MMYCDNAHACNQLRASFNLITWSKYSQLRDTCRVVSWRSFNRSLRHSISAKPAICFTYRMMKEVNQVWYPPPPKAGSGNSKLNLLLKSTITLRTVVLTYSQSNNIVIKKWLRQIFLGDPVISGLFTSLNTYCVKFVIRDSE